MRRAVVRAWMGDGSLSYRQGAVLLAGSGVVFSFTGILFRGVEEATDWQFLAVRGLGVALAMTTLVWLRRHHRPVPVSSIAGSTLAAGGLLAAMAALYVLALSRTTVAMTTAFIAAGPFSGALFGWILLRERVRPHTWIALVVAGGGIAVMVQGGVGAGSTSGVILAGLIPLLLGLYNVLVRSAPEVDPVLPALVGGVVLTAGAAVIALADGGLAMTARDVMLAAVAGFVLLGLGLPMFNLGHRYVPTAQVSLLIMTEIVLTPLWVWIWPGETPAASTLVGGLIIIAAVVWQISAADRVPLRHPVV